MVKRRWIGLIAGLVVTMGWAAPSSPSLIATPPQPKWSELTVQQKIVLAPLSDDWDSLEYFRQKKWLGIAATFPRMTPGEQRRVQAQMQEWGKLTPEQRQTARENFKTANQMSAAKKQELKQKWEEYSNLPEEEKEKLKQQAESQSGPSIVKGGRPAPLSPFAQPDASQAAPAAEAPAHATAVIDKTDSASNP
jgi:hypothetical protein